MARTSLSIRLSDPPTIRIFGYQAILRADLSGVIRRLVAYRVELDNPFLAAISSVPQQTWISALGLAVPILYDDKYQDRRRQIDRPAAERAAVESLHTILPREENLRAMCEEGELMGWTFGPPRR